MMCQNMSKDNNVLLIISSDNVELVLGSSAIPESGTASVRARPTVKHHSVSTVETFMMHIDYAYIYHSISDDGVTDIYLNSLHCNLRFTES